MNKLGFFRELRHGDHAGPSLKDSMGAQPFDREREVIEYLGRGAVLIACPGVVRDVFDEGTIIGPPHILTDGVWVWPADLAYYVKRYHCRLPEDFVRHVESIGWNPPALETDQLAILAGKLAQSDAD